MTTAVTNGRSTDLLRHSTNGVITNQSVSILAAEIRYEVEQADASMRDAVVHAIRAGDLLLEAKAMTGHGKWLRWVKANLAFDARTAQMYMRVAKHREDAKRLSHLGISGVLKELARRKDIAERTAAVEEQLAQERERLLLGSATDEQLTLRDLDLSPEIERLLVGWLEAVPVPFVDEGIEDGQLEQEYTELVALEHGLRRLRLRRAARENAAKDAGG